MLPLRGGELTAQCRLNTCPITRNDTPKLKKPPWSSDFLYLRMSKFSWILGKPFW